MITDWPAAGRRVVSAWRPCCPSRLALAWPGFDRNPPHSRVELAAGPSREFVAPSVSGGAAPAVSHRHPIALKQALISLGVGTLLCTRRDTHHHNWRCRVTARDSMHS